jgi:hypothetical protein
MPVPIGNQSERTRGRRSAAPVQATFRLESEMGNQRPPRQLKTQPLSVVSEACLSRALFAPPALGRSLGPTPRRRRWIGTSLFESYRPELHYMRGPGPKWREKHGHGDHV